MALTDAERLQMISIALMQHNVVGTSSGSTSIGSFVTFSLFTGIATIPDPSLTTIDKPE